MSLQQFPRPRIEGAYGLGSERQHHYAQRFAIAAVEYCCYSVVRRVGRVRWPLMVFDCATQDGETPPGHPRGSHNGGDDLDLGYYGLVDLNRYGYVPGPYSRERNRMTGPPDSRKFAAQAEVEWFLAMGRLEVDIGQTIVSICATDQYIERDLDPRIQAADAPRRVITQAVRICYSSRRADDGWLTHHHHHRHIRFGALRNGDEVAEYIEDAWISPLLRARPVPEFAEAVRGDTPPDQPTYLPPDEAGDKPGQGEGGGRED